MIEEGLIDHVVVYTWDAAPEFLHIAKAAGVSAVVLKSTTGEARSDINFSFRRHGKDVCTTRFRKA